MSSVFRLQSRLFPRSSTGRKTRYPQATPPLKITLDELPKEAGGRFKIAATLSEEKFCGVTFFVRVGDEEEFEPAGTEDNVPYRIFYSTSDLEDGEEIEVKAAVNDLGGNTAQTGPQTVTFRSGEPSGD
ncbi:MAG: hypothetical protein ACR2KW_05935 [Rubrobacter sp.]